MKRSFIQASQASSGLAMRLRRAASLVILLAFPVGAVAGEQTKAVYVRVSGVEAAPLLKASSEFFGAAVFIDPGLGKRRISINAEFPDRTALFMHVASVLGTVAQRGPGGIRIGRRPAELRVDPVVSREDNCPYQVHDLEFEAAHPGVLRKCQALEYHLLGSLRIVGVLGRGNEFQAVVESPDGMTWGVKVGDHMGHDFGKIYRITRSEVDLGEIKQDERGEWQEVRTLLDVE